MRSCTWEACASCVYSFNSIPKECCLVVRVTTWIRWVVACEVWSFLIAHLSFGLIWMKRTQSTRLPSLDFITHFLCNRYSNIPPSFSNWPNLFWCAIHDSKNFPKWRVGVHYSISKGQCWGIVHWLNHIMQRWNALDGYPIQLKTIRRGILRIYNRNCVHGLHDTNEYELHFLRMNRINIICRIYSNEILDLRVQITAELMKPFHVFLCNQHFSILTSAHPKVAFDQSSSNVLSL